MNIQKRDYIQEFCYIQELSFVFNDRSMRRFDFIDHSLKI